MDMPLIGAERPLCFLHISKTGGTSVTDAIARLYPSHAVFSDAGNLTTDFLQRLGDSINGRVFLAGHSGPGVARFLSGRADVITVLRRPRDQAVSAYLHVLSDPSNSLHESADRQSFADYLRENAYQLHSQSQTLRVAMSSEASQRDLGDPDQVDDLLSFLDSLPFVGVIEQSETCADVLSRIMQVDRPIQLPRLNASVYRGVSTRTLARLRAEYDGLREEPDLGRLIAVEALTYAKARSVLERLVRELGSTSSPAGRGFIPAHRFSRTGGRLAGDDHVCPLSNQTGHLIFGPYDRLPPGRYTVEFHYSLRNIGPGKGARIHFEVLANGATSLSRRWAPAGATPPGRSRTLSFFNGKGTNVLEFLARAKGFRQGEIIFHGVTVDGIRQKAGSNSDRVPRLVTRAAQRSRSRSSWVCGLPPLPLGARWRVARAPHLEGMP